MTDHAPKGFVGTTTRERWRALPAETRAAALHFIAVESERVPLALKHGLEELYRLGLAAAESEETVDLLRAEIERLRDALNRDRTGLAAGLAAIDQRVSAGWWITEGRGPYEWNDDRYRDETAKALGEVQGIARAALNASGALVTETLKP